MLRAAPEVFGGVGEPQPSADAFSSGWLLMLVTGLHPRYVVDREEGSGVDAGGTPRQHVRLSRARLQTDAEARPCAEGFLEGLMECPAMLKHGTSDSDTAKPVLSFTAALAIVRMVLTRLSRQSAVPPFRGVESTRASFQLPTS